MLRSVGASPSPQRCTLLISYILICFNGIAGRLALFLGFFGQWPHGPQTPRSTNSSRPHDCYSFSRECDTSSRLTSLPPLPLRVVALRMFALSHFFYRRLFVYNPTVCILFARREYIIPTRYILNEDTQPVIRAIGVSHTACKER